MKKVAGSIGCIIGFLLIILGSVMKPKEHTAVTIVGGADGPTSVFVAGSLNGDLSISLILIGVVVLGIILIGYLKKKH